MGKLKGFQGLKKEKKSYIQERRSPSASTGLSTLRVGSHAPHNIPVGYYLHFKAEEIEA